MRESAACTMNYMASPNLKNAAGNLPIGTTPTLEAPGVTHREADYPGNGSFGFESVPPESILRSAKGDLGNSIIPHFESRALTGPGLPFTLKKG